MRGGVPPTDSTNAFIASMMCSFSPLVVFRSTPCRASHSDFVLTPLLESRSFLGEVALVQASHHPTRSIILTSRRRLRTGLPGIVSRRAPLGPVIRNDGGAGRAAHYSKPR